MQPILTNAKIKLRSLDTKLSGSRLYQIMKSRLATLVMTLALITFFFAGPYSLNTISYNPLSSDPSSSSTDNVTYGTGFSKQDKSDLHPYDIFDSSFVENKEGSKFIFVNDKYPLAEGFDNVIKAVNPDHFIHLPLEKKCELYFRELYNKTPEWTLEELEAGHPYNGYIFDTKEQFVNDRKNDFKNSLENKDTISEEDLKKLIEEKNLKYQWDAKYLQAYKESEDTETYMRNQITNVRVFSQCYLDQKTDKRAQIEIDNMHPNITCDENEKRLFKFLTRKYPTYRRWNGEELKQLPLMQDYLNDVNHKTNKTMKIAAAEAQTHKSRCFTRDLMEGFNGKGIVISAMDKHLGELSSLILVLRALNNKLPIQIIHRGDLSLESQTSLVEVSRSLNLNLDRINSFKTYVKTNFENVRDLDVESIFPKQEIWFVDTTEAIDPNDKRFISYGNKLLTLLFSSFEDTVLIDTDTVPFVDIDQYILNSDVYKEKGAFFFKDRQLYDHITGPEMTYFKKLLPTRLDRAFFDIPELTNFTMKNRFFGEKKKHVQESGMVAINKKKHMRSTLIINILQMWHATTTRVHGDKELFWLGFSIAGDEDYYLNKHGVGAVGQLNPNSNRLLGDKDDSRRSKLKSHQLCTTHPAHLSGLDDHTLLWMNSGFITCKRENEAEKDISMDLYKNVFQNAEQLKKTYVGPLKISAVLVPPPQERVKNNDLGEPASGWEVMFGCGGYLYCAYDNIGGSNDTYFQGTLVEYDTEQQLLYDYLGELWVNYEKVLKK